jgi:hypothetical protein
MNPSPSYSSPTRGEESGEREGVPLQFSEGTRYSNRYDESRHDLYHSQETPSRHDKLLRKFKKEVIGVFLCVSWRIHRKSIIIKIQTGGIYYGEL